MATELIAAPGVEMARIVVEKSDFDGTIPVRQSVRDALDAGAGIVVLDLTACPYLGAREMGVLVSCAKLCRDREPRVPLGLRGVTEDQRTLFDLTQLTPLFDAVQP